MTAANKAINLSVTTWRQVIASVSAALRAALMAELASPAGSARPDLFFAKIER